jgi:hypothetical protein
MKEFYCHAWRVPGAELPHECHYCAHKGSDVKTIYALWWVAGINGCEAHLAWARRDVRAWWHKEGWVLIEDMLELFPEIAAIPSGAVVWKHLDGKKRGGGSIPRSAAGQMVHLSEAFKECMIPVDTNGVYEEHTFIHIHELQLSGVSHDCIIRLQSKLKTGFYKDDFDAYTAAAKEELAASAAIERHEN